MPPKPKAPGVIEIRYRLSPTGRDEDLYKFLSTVKPSAQGEVCKNHHIDLYAASLHPMDRIIVRE